jgi:outer membrane receptor protein involved in Fe transport
MWRI